jgi:ABC-2 type transport system permease protein
MASIAVLNVVDLLLLGVLLERFNALGGWSLWEIVFLYSFFLIALGIQNTFTSHLLELEDMVRDGTLDMMLVRPVPPLIQLLGRDIRFNRLPDLVLGCIGVAIASERLGLVWTAPRLALGALMAISGAVLLASIVLALSSIAFWTVKSRVFVLSTVELQEVVQHYPSQIFGKWFLLVVTTLLPFAFINYYPTLLLLGRASDAPNQLLAWSSPFAAAVVAALAVVVWQTGLRSYESTGS